MKETELNGSSVFCRVPLDTVIARALFKHTAELSAILILKQGCLQSHFKNGTQYINGTQYMYYLSLVIRGHKKHGIRIQKSNSIA